MLFKAVLSVDKDMMGSVKEFGGIAGVVAVVGTAAPVVASGGDFQLGCHGL